MKPSTFKNNKLNLKISKGNKLNPTIKLFLHITPTVKCKQK